MTAQTNLEDLSEDTTPKVPTKGANIKGAYLLIFLLFLAVGYLFYDNYNIKQQLDYATLLAENADRYSHSHYSDERLKENIKPLEDSLENIQKLEGVSFTFDVDKYPHIGLPKGKQTGMIAQEVEKVFPELVTIGSDGYRRVDYAALAPVLLEAIKEQQAEIEDLEVRLTTLESSR